MLTISDVASRHLEAWLDDLMRGRLELYQLPSPVRAFYDLGLIDGRAAATGHLTERIAYLEHENDQLYIRAFHQEGARREEILRRLDAGLAEASEEVWDQLEQDLREMRGYDPREVAA